MSAGRCHGMLPLTPSIIMSLSMRPPVFGFVKILGTEKIPISCGKDASIWYQKLRIEGTQEGESSRRKLCLQLSYKQLRRHSLT